MLCGLLSEQLENTNKTQNIYCEEIGKHKAEKNKYRDDNFLPKIPKKEEDKEIIPSSTTWDRVEKVYEQCTHTDFKNCEIRRGSLKDDALIAVFSALMTSNEIVMKWFQQPIEIVTGIICVNIPFRGKIVSVNIDTKVPRIEGKPVLSHPVRPGFPWCAFIEKALAKLLGSFHAVEQLTVKEILYQLFGYSSRTIPSQCATEKLITEIGETIKDGKVAFVTIGHKKESEDAGLNPGSAYIIQNVTTNNDQVFALLFNPGGKRRFISTFEERVDKWKQDARFPKVKDDSFVFRSHTIQKHTESVVIGFPTPKTEFINEVKASIKEGSEMCEKQFKLKSDKFSNVGFVIESSVATQHCLTLLEDGKLKTRVTTSDTIEFFVARTDPEKTYTINISSKEKCDINITFRTDSAITVEEEDYTPDPLVQIGSDELTPGKWDGRFPQEPSNVACLPQWLMTFKDKGIIKVKIINKTICEAKHVFYIAETDGERFRIKGDSFYTEHEIEGQRDSAEWEVEIPDASKKYIFGFYRDHTSVITRFDFEIRSESSIEMQRLNYFTNDLNTAVLEDKVGSSKYDNRSPLPGNPGITRLKQWILNVDQEKTVYVVLEHDEGKHTVCMQPGEIRINHFTSDEHYMFESFCKYDTFEFKAVPGSYVFTIIREQIRTVTDYKLTFLSEAKLSIKQIPTLSTEKCKVYSRDIRFQAEENTPFFPIENKEAPDNQYYLVVPEPCFLIGIVETNSSQDDATYCLYIEDNDGKRLKEANPSHINEHAIGNKDNKEWFTFDVDCDPEKGTILTFCVTRKGGDKKTSIAVRFFAKFGLSISSAQNDLTEDMKDDFIKAAKEAQATNQLSRRPSYSDMTRSQRAVGKSTANLGGTSGPNQSNCCLLF